MLQHSLPGPPYRPRPTFAGASLLLLPLLLLPAATAVAQGNDAFFLEQAVPATLAPGEVATVVVTMNNSGATTWQPGTHFLGSQSPQDNTTWGLNRVPLSRAIVPGDENAFEFNITAPTVPGFYDFQWRMLQEHVEWFGDLSFPKVRIEVLPPVDDAQFVNQSVPTTLWVGEQAAVDVIFRNVGTSTWWAGQYALATQNPPGHDTWGTNWRPVTGNVGAGHTVRFAFDIAAPDTPGTYPFQWQMTNDATGYFGGLSPAVAITVRARPASCGDGVCQPELGENTANCPGECTAACGNGHCDAGEDVTCPFDCPCPTQRCAAGCALTPAFTVSEFAPAVGQAVTFTVANPGALHGSTVNWDFGDAQHCVACGHQVTHTYAATGAVAARLTATENVCFTTQVSAPAVLQVTPAPTSCPNRVCEIELGENTQTCPEDCDENCGDGVCEGIEDLTCPSDCVCLTQTCEAGCASTPELTVSDPTPTVGQPVTFSVANPGDLVPGSPVNWDFGNGDHCPQCGQEVTYAYKAAGTPRARLTATENVCLSTQVSPFLSLQVTEIWNHAHYLSQTVPTRLLTGQTAPVVVTLRNVGDSTWDGAHGHHLVSQNPPHNTVWGLDRVPVTPPLAPADPESGSNGERSFQFQITAPATPGLYPFQWQMAQGSDWFGNRTPSVLIEVVDSPHGDDAQALAHDLPYPLAGGAVYTATVRIKNTGTTTWACGGEGGGSACDYNLGVARSTLLPAGMRIPLPDRAPVPPGATAEFSLQFEAPPEDGFHELDLQMVHEGVGWFGQVLEIRTRVLYALDPQRLFTVTPGSGGPGTVVVLRATVPEPTFPAGTQAELYFGDPRGHGYAFVSSGGTLSADQATLAFVIPEVVDCGRHYFLLRNPAFPDRFISIGAAFEIDSGCSELRRQSLDLMTYNVKFLPFFLCDKCDYREPLIARHPDIQGHDAIAFVEAFADTARIRLARNVRDEYPYQTTVLGCGILQALTFCSDKLVNGGVFIVSKWPILADNEHVYEACYPFDTAHPDCVSAKGVRYGIINKAGALYHVFATHTDAGQAPGDVTARTAQLGELREFIEDLRPSADEPVLITGDLNVDLHSTTEPGAAKLELTVGGILPPIIGPPYSNPSSQWLDYVLYSKFHQPPTTATNQAFQPKDAQGKDLSDHYPVLGRFHFPGAAAASTCAGAPAAAPLAESPAGTVGDSTPLLSWEPVAGAVSYDLSIREIEGARILLQRTGIGGTLFTVPEALPVDTDLSWDVRAVNECGEGPTSAPASLRIERSPDGPPISPPKLAWPGGEVDDATPVFGWSPVDGATSYALTGFAADGTVIEQGEIAGTSFTPVEPLPPGQEIVWSVRAVNQHGEGPFARPFFFTTAEHRATFVGLSVPGAMAVGGSYDVSLDVLNAGTTSWAPGEGFELRRVGGPQGLWGIDRVSLPAPASPGEIVRFAFDVTAPTVPGAYTFAWQLAGPDGGLIEEPSPPALVGVGGELDAACIGHDIPAVWLAGESRQVELTLENTGSLPWIRRRRFGLAPSPAAGATSWAGGFTTLPVEIVEPGQTATFVLHLTAPTAPGTHTLQYRMARLDVASFGQVCGRHSVTIAGVIESVSATASSSADGHPPASAVDGLPTTYWTSGALPPGWIQLDLGQEHRVEKVSLLVPQTPDGPTTHRLEVLPTEHAPYAVGELAGSTNAGQWLGWRAPYPLEGVRHLRIHTIGGPAWVAWGEIEVYGIPAGPEATWETDTFDYLETGSLSGQNGWDQANVGPRDEVPRDVARVEAAPATGKMLALDPAPRTTIAMTKNVVPQASGRHALSFRAMVTATAAANLARLEIRSSSQSWDRKLRILLGSSIRLDSSHAGAAATLVPATTPGRWYEVRCELDLDGGTADVWVDGVPVATALPMAPGPVSVLGLGAWDETGAVYIDDLEARELPLTP